MCRRKTQLILDRQQTSRRIFINSTFTEVCKDLKSQDRNQSSLTDHCTIAQKKITLHAVVFLGLPMERAHLSYTMSLHSILFNCPILLPLSFAPLVSFQYPLDRSVSPKACGVFASLRQLLISDRSADHHLVKHIYAKSASFLGIKSEDHDQPFPHITKNRTSNVKTALWASRFVRIRAKCRKTSLTFWLQVVVYR